MNNHITKIFSSVERDQYNHKLKRDYFMFVKRLMVKNKITLYNIQKVNLQFFKFIKYYNYNIN